jgi:hypothetical protein
MREGRNGSAEQRSERRRETIFGSDAPPASLALPSRGEVVWAGGVTTRPAGYPSGGVPPAVERQLHLHHTPSRVPKRWGTTSCREASPLTPHAQPGTQAVGYHQLSRGSSTYFLSL